MIPARLGSTVALWIQQMDDQDYEGSSGRRIGLLDNLSGWQLLGLGVLIIFAIWAYDRWF